MPLPPRTAHGSRGIVAVAALAALLLVSPGRAEDRPATLAGGDAPVARPELTGAERAWLEAHPRIRLAFDPFFPPHSFLDDAGELEGLAVDVLDLVAERAGLEFEVVPPTTWEELYRAAQTREVDVVATMVERPARTAWFGFTEPYIHKSLVIMTRADDLSIRVREDVAGKRVALVKSYQISQRILEDYPSIRPVFVDTMHDALNAVSTGGADAAITFAGAGHYLQTRYLITNLRFAALYDRDASAESIAVRSDWPELVSILDKTLATLTEKERLDLQRAWLPVEALAARSPVLELGERDRAWIAAHPTIRIGVDPEFSPFEFLDERGVHRGISADYLELLGRRLGLRFELVEGLTWKETVEAARRGEIDVLPCVGITEERRAFLRFTDPYVEFQRVIITRTDTPFLTGVDDLHGLVVVVQASSSHEGFLREFTDLPFVTRPTLEASLRAVAGGEVDAFVGNVAASAHWIRALNLTNLKVAAPAVVEGFRDSTLHMAVRKDWPDLVAILQKGLDAIGPADRDRIARRWVVLRYEPRPDYGLAARVALGGAVALALALLWARQSRRQADALRAARDEAVRGHAEAEKANAALRDLRDHLEDLVAERTVQLRDSERQLWQAQKMEALGTFVGGIAHDFNNVLTGIVGSVGLARRHAAGGDPGRVAGLLADAQELALRAGDLVQHLLSFARSEEVAKAEVPLVSILEETTKLARLGIPEDVELDLVLPGEEVVVEGNVTALQQLVLNLVTNARDAVEGVSAPRIAIRLERRELDGGLRARHPDATGERYAVIVVEDNGAGIDHEHLDRLFDPFFTTKAPGRGTGLGLAMVYATVRDAGGFVEVESEPGGGSRFRVHLPEAGPGARAGAHRGWERRPGEGETILVVDDEETVRSTTAAVLEDLGYRVRTAPDGERAVELCREHPGEIDLVLMDLVMPRLDGFRAAERMRAVDPDVAVLFATGYDVHGALPGDFPAGRHTIVAKPFEVDYLSHLLRERLERARRARGEPGDGPVGGPADDQGSAQVS